MLDLDTDFDPQDAAETFDETHRQDQTGADDLRDEPDLANDAPDLTSTLGDADEDDLATADEMDPDDLDDLDPDDEEEDDEDEDDDLDDDLEDEPEDEDLDLEDSADPGESDRLDEGLEETFPASDPVSAKHIS
jgi:ribonuclease E